jgi:hypothetical protein
MQKSLELHAQQLESTLEKMQKPLAFEVQQVKAHVGELWVVDMLFPLELMQMKDALVLWERLQVADMPVPSELLQGMVSDHLPF